MFKLNFNLNEDERALYYIITNNEKMQLYKKNNGNSIKVNANERRERLLGHTERMLLIKY